MHYIFLENSINFTSSCLNFKAIDSFQRVLIHFSRELVRKNHKVTIYNNTAIKKNDGGVYWRNISEASNSLVESDVCIICNDVDFLNFNIKAKLKLFWINSDIDLNNYKKTMINLLKNKFIILYNSDALIFKLPHNFKYIPKIQFNIGFNDDFFQNENFNINNCNALVTIHPLRGLDWLLDIWANIISLKLPWAEMHIYSHTLYKKGFVNNVKINNLKLKLFKYKNSGILIKKPQVESDFINTLSNYRVHLNPSKDIMAIPSSIIESQARGIPIVSRENDDVYNYIYNNETGYITNEKNIFSNKTIDLLTNNSLFLRMKSNSKLNNKINNWEVIVENFEKKIYENIIHR